MRVLVVMNLYPPHSYGGYEGLCAGVVNRWREAGHDVHVLTSTHRREGVERAPVGPAGEPVRRVLPIAWDDHVRTRPGWRTLLRWQRRAHREVRAALREVRPDVVSVWNPGALPLGPFREFVDVGVPVALVVGDRWLVRGRDSDPWLRWAADHPRLATPVRAATGHPTDVPRLGAHVTALFASDFLRRDAAEHGTWPVDTSAVVPHGVDVERYPPVMPDDVDGRPWTDRLLFVGRITPEKGATTAVRALAHLPAGTTLDVVGTGREQERRRIADLARELGVADRVRLHGEAGSEQLRGAYDAADALVFPSRWEEPFGIVPLEAMARGLPVVATGTGGSGEVCVDEVTCLRFDRDDEAGLATAVTRLAEDGALRGRLRTNGVAVARHLTQEATARELLAWHRHLAGDGPPPAPRPVLPTSLA